MQPDYELKLDLDEDDVYETDISDYLLEVSELSLKRKTALDAFSPRKCELTLDNADGRFAPYNRNGPYYPYFKRGVRAQFKILADIGTQQAAHDNPSFELDIAGVSAFGSASVGWTVEELIEPFDTDNSVDWQAGGDVGATWTWQPSSGRLRVTGGTYANYRRKNFKAVDVDIDLDCNWVRTDTEGDGGVIYRYQDQNNFYVAYQDGGTLIRLAKRVAGGSLSVIDTYTIPASAYHLLKGRHMLRVLCEGTVHKVFFDGRLVINATDSAITAAGEAGIFSSGGVADYQYYYSIRIRDLVTRAYYGKAALKVTTANVATSGALILKRDASRIACSPGQYVTALARVNVGASSKQLRLRVRFLNSSLGEISQVTQTLTCIEDTWTPFQISAIAPALTAYIDLATFAPTAQGVFDFWVDGIFVAVNAASYYSGEYFDGDSPLASWSGTPHASTPRRILSSGTILGSTGTFTDLGIERDTATVKVHLQSVIEARLARAQLKIGAMVHKTGSDIIYHLCDIMSNGRILDPASRVIGDAWQTVTGGGSTPILNLTALSAVGSSPDPEDYLAIEGDNFIEITQWGTTGDGLELDVTGVTAPGQKYRFTMFLGTEDSSAVDHDVKIGLWDDVSGEQVAIYSLSTTPVYRLVEGTFNAASATRKVRIALAEAGHTDQSQGGHDHSFYLSYPHLGRFVDMVYPSFTAKYHDVWTRQLEYVDAYYRSARAVFEEVATSAGGWVYDGADRWLAFEAFDTRHPSAIPKRRYSTSLNGNAARIQDYEEPLAYNRVKVRSRGGVSVLTSKNQIVWELEPSPMFLDPDEKVILHCDFASTEADLGGLGEMGSLIGRQVRLLCANAGGSFATDPDMRNKQTPYIEVYGRSADITIIAGASGAGPFDLAIAARAAHRGASEITMIEESIPGTQLEDPQMLDIVVPCQATRTQTMKDIAAWAADKYGRGPTYLELDIEGASFEEMLAAIDSAPGLSVWVQDNQGQGNLGINGLFYVEGWVYKHRIGQNPVATLWLEEAWPVE